MEMETGTVPADGVAVELIMLELHPASSAAITAAAKMKGKVLRIMIPPGPCEAMATLHLGFPECT
jgi:hypothetical protein